MPFRGLSALEWQFGTSHAERWTIILFATNGRARDRARGSDATVPRPGGEAPSARRPMLSDLAILYSRWPASVLQWLFTAASSSDSPAKRRRAASRHNTTCTSTMNTSTLAEQERASVPLHAVCKRCAGGQLVSACSLRTRSACR